MQQEGKRLTIVQYAGDFREASQRLAAGGHETYRGQRYTVEFVEKLASKLASVTTITGITDSYYEAELPSGAVAIGAGFKNRLKSRSIVQLVAKTNPDLLILRTPLRGVLLWALLHNRRTLLLLADSFDSKSAKTRLSGAILSIITKFPNIDWIANHGLRSAEQLIQLGVPARKVLAWDYPAFDTPEKQAPKTKAEVPCHILYVGLMIREKGVDDLIMAVQHLVAEGRRIHLNLVGKLEDERLSSLIMNTDIQEFIHKIGPVANADIISTMRASDIVVVPSLHEYPEGLPLTIYEALCARTPLIVSDHPMFTGNIVDQESGLVFPAGDVKKLASAIVRLIEDRALYRQLSERSLATWHRLQISLKWADLIDDWIEDSPTSRARLTAQALATQSK